MEYHNKCSRDSYLNKDAILEKRKYAITSVAVFPDSQYIASGSYESIIRLWKINLGKQLQQITHQTKIRQYSSFWSNGKFILSGSADGTLQITHIDPSNYIRSELNIQIIMDSLRCLMADHENQGKSIEGICIDKACQAPQRIWCVICLKKYHLKCQRDLILIKEEVIEKLSTLKNTRQKESLLENLLILKKQILKQLDELEQMISTYLIDQTTNVNDRIHKLLQQQFTTQSWMETYDLLQQSNIQEQPQTLSESLDYFDSIQKELDKVQICLNKQKLSTPWFGNQTSQIIEMASWIKTTDCSPDGKYICCGFNDFSVRIYEPRTGNQVGLTLEGHSGSIHQVKYSPDGRYLASASGDKTIIIWDIKSQQQFGKSLKGHESSVRSLDYSPNGQFIISGSTDKSIRIWNCQTQTQVDGPIIGHKDGIMSLQYSPDGSCFVSGCFDRMIYVWDSSNRKLLKEIIGHTNPVNSVQFSKDGKVLASAGYDKFIKLWNTKTWTQIGKSLFGNTGSILSVAFSLDSKYIASGSEDNLVHIWDLMTHETICKPLDMHTGSVNSVQFSLDGRYIISGSNDKTLQITSIEAILK